MCKNDLTCTQFFARVRSLHFECEDQGIRSKQYFDPWVLLVSFGQTKKNSKWRSKSKWRTLISGLYESTCRLAILWNLSTPQFRIFLKLSSTLAVLSANDGQLLCTQTILQLIPYQRHYDNYDAPTRLLNIPASGDRKSYAPSQSCSHYHNLYFDLELI